jgi:cytoskeletal protein RodZ
MNINRHNYEEFFLLYVDKELSAADRKTVEVFVKENPDLQMELDLLQQTVVNADDIVLQKKDWLYMEEDISALQENLLLYGDAELNTTDKNAVESLLNTNASVKAEWNILQQTKLQPDMAVVFEDKASLYRKEDGRVVAFKWWRVAAAAVLLGFGLWTGVSVYTNNSKKGDGSEVAVKENKVESQQEKTETVADVNQATTAVENTVAENNTASTNQQNNSQTQPGEKNTTTTEKVNSADKQNSTAFNQTVTQQNSNPKKTDNNLPKPYFENINNEPGNKTIASNVQSENNNSVRVSGNNDAVAKINPRENKTIDDINNSKTNANITAMQVVNTNTDEGDNNSSYLNVDDSKGKRTALGGFIRKAKRVLERTTNVKTGEGVKIAGFEIALK